MAYSYQCGEFMIKYIKLEEQARPHALSRSVDESEKQFVYLPHDSDLWVHP